eukprot:7152927-Pyramimonas_sp.AAC.1
MDESEEEQVPLPVEGGAPEALDGEPLNEEDQELAEFMEAAGDGDPLGGDGDFEQEGDEGAQEELEEEEGGD